MEVVVDMSLRTVVTLNVRRGSLRVGLILTQWVMTICPYSMQTAEPRIQATSAHTA